MESKYTPSWVKKYQTAWYLSPKKWSARLPSEKLQDPKENKEKQMSESKKKSKDLVRFSLVDFIIISPRIQETIRFSNRAVQSL